MKKPPERAAGRREYDAKKKTGTAAGFGGGNPAACERTRLSCGAVHRVEHRHAVQRPAGRARAVWLRELPRDPRGQDGVGVQHQRGGADRL